MDPRNPSHFYAGVASGGVWKTDNDGTTWTPVFDKEASYSIGAVALDPKDPSIVWVGTGESNSQRSVAYGDGVYRSEDGGKSWKNVGLKKSEHIGRIVIHPKDTSTVYVAAQGPLWAAGGDRGLYKTTDAGATWKKVLEISENTGVTDVVLDPENPDVIYAAAYQRRRHVFTMIDGGPESAIYKSTDAGATLEQAQKRPAHRRHGAHWPGGFAGRSQRGLCRDRSGQRRRRHLPLTRIAAPPGSAAIPTTRPPCTTRRSSPIRATWTAST